MVELLVVMGVLALLMAIAIPMYAGIRRSQKVKRMEAMVQALSGGIEAYANDYGVFPPAEFADPADGRNRGNLSLVALLNAKGGRSWPYVPRDFLDDGGDVRGPLLLDEWGWPFIYFDASVMKDDTVHQYTLRVLSPVKPIKGPSGFYNSGRFQLWSCGANGLSNDGLNLHNDKADDLANFQAEGGP